MSDAQTTEQGQSFATLAAEMFGPQYTGERKKEEAPPVVEDVVDEVVEEVVEESGEDAPVEAEESAEESLADIIRQNFEHDPSLYAALRLPVKVDGEASEATIDELVRSYQIQSAAEKRLEEAKVRARTIQDEATAKSLKVDEHMAMAARVIQAAESALTRDIEKSNLAQLRDTDPAEYAAAITDFKARRDEVEAMKVEAVQTYRAYSDATQEELKKQHEERLLVEHEALLNAVPEWKDATKAQAEKTKLGEYLVGGMGFDPNDIATAADHRLFVMARKAMLYDEMQTHNNAATKKIATVPKVLKPGAPKPQDQITRENEQKLRDRLRRTGSIDDAFALLQAKQRRK